MLPLSETQLRLRNAVVAGDASSVSALLVGGRNPQKRLAIHQRHYRSSLVTALLTRFPATTWLIGTPFLEAAAREFVRDHPPRAPCIAEYGEAFPHFLSRRPGAEHIPYLLAFAELEWHVGLVAISVDAAACSMEHVSRFEPEILMDAGLRLQPGLRYLAASWPADELMTLYLGETAPDEYRLAPADVWLEIRGARGEFAITRLDSAEFAFRKTVWDGGSIGAAAEKALDVTATFDAGHALARFVAEQLLTAITPLTSGRQT